MCFKESGGKQSFSILAWEMDSSPWQAPVQTKQQEHSQLCQQLGRALLATFLKFWFLLPPSKSFQKLSWSNYPCSHLPIPCMLHISEKFPPAPSAEEKGRCSRGTTTMAREREAQGTFPSRITFVINQNIAIFSWTVFSIQICTLYFPLSFSRLPGRPIPKHLGMRARGVENHRVSMEKQCKYFCLILIYYWNLASRHGTERM